MVEWDFCKNCKIPDRGESCYQACGPLRLEAEKKISKLEEQVNHLERALSHGRGEQGPPMLPLSPSKEPDKDKDDECPRCKGLGQTWQVILNSAYGFGPCPVCKGTGKKPKDPDPTEEGG